MLDYLNVLLTGVILGAAGTLMLIGNEENEPEVWALRFVPYLFAALGLLAIVQISRWLISKKLLERSLPLNGDD